MAVESKSKFPLAVLFDWAGTTIDFGSRAPTLVIVEIFRRRGIELTELDARGPMGMAKRDHLATLMELPHVKSAWIERFGEVPSDADIDALYADFLPLQKQVLGANSDLIPGVLETMEYLVSRGVRVGSTTGYTRELMEIVAPIAHASGYKPEVIVCSDEVRQGRPAPWQNFRAAELLGVYPMNRVVVVDDTAVGIEAGKNAGAMTVGVAISGNGIGLTQEKWRVLSVAEQEQRGRDSTLSLERAGADYVISSVAELPALIENWK